jgi:hypothetical protein
MKMANEKLQMNDWQIPFMLFELSSYAKSKKQQKQQQLTGTKLVKEMNSFFGEGSGEAPIHSVWDYFIN